MRGSLAPVPGARGAGPRSRGPARACGGRVCGSWARGSIWRAPSGRRGYRSRVSLARLERPTVVPLAECPHPVDLARVVEGVFDRRFDHPVVLGRRARLAVALLFDEGVVPAERCNAERGVLVDVLAMA